MARTRFPQVNGMICSSTAGGGGRTGATGGSLAADNPGTGRGLSRRPPRTAGANPDGLVFTTPIGTTLRPDSFGRAVNRVTERAIGRRVGPHALRHTAATLLHEAGVSMKVAQVILGHTTDSMTSKVYTHTLDEQFDRAAAALDGLLSGDRPRPRPRNGGYPLFARHELGVAADGDPPVQRVRR